MGRLPKVLEGNIALKPPVVLGEVLFDLFPDGNRVLGGACFNVAWHLQALGLQPRFITRVGKDPLGDQILKAMADWGMDIAAVQIDPEHSTGTVNITFDPHGEPIYDSKHGLAFDFLNAEEAQRFIEPGSFLYHGTYTARDPVSRETLLKLIQTNRLDRFIDINLRAGCWQRETVLKLLKGAVWLKMNDNEQRELENPFEIPNVLITSGASDATFMQNGKIVATATPPTPSSYVNSVGAGDAFTAAAIFGLYKGWPPAILLQRACDFASVFCSIQGAVSLDCDFYRRLLQ